MLVENYYPSDIRVRREAEALVETADLMKFLRCQRHVVGREELGLTIGCHVEMVEEIDQALAGFGEQVVL